MRFQAKVNKILDHYFIMEGQNEDRALAMLKKAGKEQFYNSLLELTADKNNKNKHLPILVKFFLEGQSIDIIKNYYDRYASNTKLNQKPIDNLTFQQFEQMVDSAVVSTNVKTKTLDDKPLYEDENVKIYLGDTKEKCIKYGQGSKYGFCIARQDSSNLYWGYRSRGATFYFVYFKQKQENAPTDLIVIHAYPNDQYQVNYAKPNADHSKSKQEIVNEFPVLDGLIGKVIVHREHSEKEKEILKVKDAGSILDLERLEDKLLWIELGNEIYSHNQKTGENEWNFLKQKDYFNEILKKYIEVGMHDIPEDVIKGTKYEKRYWEKIKQRLDAKLKSVDYVADFELNLDKNGWMLTNDETYQYYEKKKEFLDSNDIVRFIFYLFKDPDDKNIFYVIKENFKILNKKQNNVIISKALEKRNWDIVNFYADEGYDSFICSMIITTNKHDLFDYLSSEGGFARDLGHPSRKIFSKIIENLKEMGLKFIKHFFIYHSEYANHTFDRMHQKTLDLLKKLDYNVQAEELEKLYNQVKKLEN